MTQKPISKNRRKKSAHRVCKWEHAVKLEKRKKDAVQIIQKKKTTAKRLEKVAIWVLDLHFLNCYILEWGYLILLFSWSSRNNSWLSRSSKRILDKRQPCEQTDFWKGTTAYTVLRNSGCCESERWFSISRSWTRRLSTHFQLRQEQSWKLCITRVCLSSTHGIFWSYIVLHGLHFAILQRYRIRRRERCFKKRWFVKFQHHSRKRLAKTRMGNVSAS